MKSHIASMVGFGLSVLAASSVAMADTGICIQPWEYAWNTTTHGTKACSNHGGYVASYAYIVYNLPAWGLQGTYAFIDSTTTARAPYQVAAVAQCSDGNQYSTGFQVNPSNVWSPCGSGTTVLEGITYTY
jgi:hypothetical protein